MNFLGVGPLEIALVCLLALLVLGPDGLVQAARKTAAFYRRLTDSELGKGLSNSQNLLDNLVGDFKSEVGLEEYRAYLDSLDLPAKKSLDRRDTPSRGKTPEVQGQKDGESQPGEERSEAEPQPVDLSAGLSSEEEVNQ
jgi:Sec-independent protein translocase protein TatA